MATTSKFKINGVIDTSEAVFKNIELLATSAGCFITWDPLEGHWSVIVNEAGTSVFSFNNSNIIGAITLGGSGVNELYNSCEIEFPHKDLRDAVDYLTVSIPSADRFTNELDNQLSIKLNTINDPIQAQIIATQELKQNRVDKVIEFQSDFTANGLKAGDIIDVTNTALAYSAKLFRVIQISEEDSDDGAIIYNITALEYDSNVYSTAGLTYEYRTKNNGIPSKIVNEEIVKSDAQDIGDTLKRLLLANVVAGLFNPSQSGVLGNILKSVFGVATDAEGDPVDDDGNKIIPASEAVKDKIIANAKAPALSTISSSAEQICEGDTVTITIGHTCEVCLFDIPDIAYAYEITGVLDSDITIPLTGTVVVSGGSGQLEIPTTDSAGGVDYQTMSVTVGAVNTSVDIYATKDYTYSVTASDEEITEGGNVIVTLTTTGSKLNSTIPYVITGSGVSRISSPALTGTVTASAGTATLTINTTDDGSYTGTQDITVTFESDLVDPCGTVGVNSTTVSILDNDVEPPADTNCLYISVPMIWCGTFNGSDDQLQSLTELASINLPVPRAGEATVAVPTEVSVTKGNPSTISVTATANVAATALQSTMGGQAVNIITSFDSVAPLGLIKGTTITVYGY